VLAFWDRLSSAQREGWWRQIDALDFERLPRCGRFSRRRRRRNSAADVEPADVLRLEGVAREEAREAGVAALRAGEVGAVLVAGRAGFPARI